MSALDGYFKISDRGSSVAREVRGGVVTFFTMAYIVVLNPIILSSAKDVNGHSLGGTTHGFVAIAAGTALVAGVMSILMGAVANYPLALATGLGLNAFVAFTLAAKMSWADAMGLVVIEGIVILVLVLTGFRTAVFHAVPRELKTAISVGIGLFIAFIGFVDAGFAGPGSGTPVQLGSTGQLEGWPLVVFAFGLVLVVALWARKVRGAILIAILASTVLAVVIQAIHNQGTIQDSPTGWQLNVPKWHGSLFSTPHFDTLGHFDLFGSFQQVGFVSTILFAFTLVLSDFFDTMGTMTAIGAEGDLLDEEGIPVGTERILVVDAAAAAAGGIAGVSSNTAFIESASGVGEGARTGLASIVTGVLFLVTILLSNLVQIIPSEAAVPALVLVGFLMMQQATDIDWKDVEVAIPAFLTVVLMPFTYSITNGIGAGFLSYVLIKAVKGKASEVSVLMWVISAFFLLYFAIHPVTELLT